MKYFYILIVAMGFAACDPAPAASTAVVAPPVATDTLPWQDALVEKYVQTSENPLLNSFGKDSVSWIWDRMVTNDSTTYFICNIGKDVVDANGARFASAQWVYIDTVSRQLYEYDVPKDTLIKWNK